MKRIQSVILLFSFLVGTLQPILPMIEYQLHEGSVIELLNHQADDVKANCNAELCAASECESQQADENQHLLNGNYYPLALQITPAPQPVVFPHKFPLYLPEINAINNPYFLPIPPPPRLS